MNERGKLVERVKTLRLEIHQAFLDADHWNRSHSTEEPVNPDPAGELKELAARLDRTLDAENLVLIGGVFFKRNGQFLNRA